MSSSLFGRTIGANLVNPVLHHIDIDELIVQRIDWNAVLERIDVDRLIERINVDALIDRVDLDRLLKKVDVADLVRRSNLDAIIQQSTTGVLTTIFDLLRVQLIRFDQVLHSLFSCFSFSTCGTCAFKSPRKRKKPQRQRPTTSRRWLRVHQLPAKPGASAPGDDATWPTRATEWAVTMQGRHAGMISRSLAYLCDRAIQTLLFALGVLLLAASADILFGKDWYKDSEFLTKYKSILVAICYFLFIVFYETVSIAFVGRTIGKSIFGLLIVKTQGRPISLGQALVRAILLTPIPWVLISAWFGVLRRDRRAVHDLVVGTCVIYNWDARRFQIREAAVTESQRQQDPMLHDYSTV
jgi:uncharacterized RDD family membrane protein YckC